MILSIPHTNLQEVFLTSMRDCDCWGLTRTDPGQPLLQRYLSLKLLYGISSIFSKSIQHLTSPPPKKKEKKNRYF